MSVIIRPIATREYSHIVMAKNEYYYVDSAFLGDSTSPFARYETMIFECDRNGFVFDWGGVYTETYSTYADMANGHQYIIENLEEVLGDASYFSSRLNAN